MKETANINVSINTQEELKKTADVPALVKKAEGLTITNQEQYTLAGDILKEIKTRIKELDDERKKITKPLDDAKKAVMNLFKPPTELLEKAEVKVKTSMLAHTEEQERKAREEEKRLREIAEKEAERQRKALEAKIMRAESSGKTEKAEELREQIENIAIPDIPVVAPAIETPKGISYRDKWTAEVVDFKALPDEYKIANQQALDKVAQATKGALTIPGVKFKSEKIVVSSRS